MRTLRLAIALALLLAAPATANTWTNCVDDNAWAGNISPTTLACLDCLGNATGTNDCVDSRLFFVVAPEALICFNPDSTASEGADVAQIKIRYCSSGVKPSANPEYSCHSITTNPITGITGSPGVQDACHPVGPGAYFIDFTTDGGAADTPEVTIQGRATQ
jgi:hypothetical protein